MDSNYTRMAPSKIFFTQNSIAAEFQNGYSVNETLREIELGEMFVEDFPAMRVVKMNNKYYSLDNRRLYVFRVLEKRGKLKSVDVRIVERVLQGRITTKNGGRSVKIRGDQTYSHEFKKRKNRFGRI